MIKNWRSDKVNCDIILMADMNKYIGDKKDIFIFCQSNNMIDSIILMNLELDNDPTYLWRSKRIDCMFISPALAKAAVKAGYHQFNQHFLATIKVHIFNSRRRVYLTRPPLIGAMHHTEDHVWEGEI